MIEQGSCIGQSRQALESAASIDKRHEVLKITLVNLLTRLALRKWLIARVTAIAMLAGGVLCLVLPVRYSATTRLMPPQQTQSSASLLMSQLTSSGAGSIAAMAGGGLALRNPNDIYVSLLNSRPIADAVIHEFDLKRAYRSRNMTEARRRLANNTQVSSEKGGVIVVAVMDKDKKRVADIANAYTDQLRILTKNLAVAEALQRRLFYEDQLKQAKEALVTAEASFQQVQQARGLVQLDAQAKAMIEGLAALRAHVAAKQVELEAMRSYSTAHNPDVEMVERELSSLQSQAAGLEQRNHTPGFTGMGLADVPGAGLDYLRAEHELKYRQAMFDLLIRQYDAARLDEVKDAAIIQVFEPAIEPDRASSPRRPVIFIGCSVFGFLAGCALVPLLSWKNAAQADAEFLKRLQGLKDAVAGTSGMESLTPRY